MKCRQQALGGQQHCRAPQGARGLKSVAHNVDMLITQTVAPRKGRVG